MCVEKPKSLHWRPTGVDVVIVMVTNENQAESVLYGRQGAVKGGVSDLRKSSLQPLQMDPWWIMNFSQYWGSLFCTSSQSPVYSARRDGHSCRYHLWVGTMWIHWTVHLWLLFAALGNGSTVILCSTVSPAFIRKLEARLIGKKLDSAYWNLLKGSQSLFLCFVWIFLSSFPTASKLFNVTNYHENEYAAEGRDLHVVDAPVSGGTAKAASGTLTVWFVKHFSFRTHIKKRNSTLCFPKSFLKNLDHLILLKNSLQWTLLESQSCSSFHLNLLPLYVLIESSGSGICSRLSILVGHTLPHQHFC